MKRFLSIILPVAVVVNAMAQTSFPNPTIKIEADDQPTDVKVHIASNDGSNRLVPHYIGFGSDNSRVDGTITLNTGNRLQPIDGFGFAITGSAAYNLMKMEAQDRKQLLTQVFSREHGYGCNYVRVPIGCSDFSLHQYTCCDAEGIDNFALSYEETDYIIPVMKEILAINPTVKVISAPWTAPRWMKNNKEWTGGNLEWDHYWDYATYFVKWIRAFEDNGIKIYGVTPQNEPLNWGNSASMYMSWQEQASFIKNALGPKFEQDGITTKIYVYDHNYNYDNNGDQNHYPIHIYEDKDASKYVAGAAYHNYGGDASEMSYIHSRYPDKELIFTEWTAGTWSWPGVGMEAITNDAQQLLFNVINNWGRGAVVWNLLLDSDRGPYRPGGCDTGNGAVDVSTWDYKTLTFNSFYYVMCVAASAVSDGANYISTNGSATDIQILAFENTDGYGAILMNTSNNEKKIKVKEGNHEFVAVIPAWSIASYRW